MLIGYVMRRVLATVPVLLLVSVITFGLMYFVPGDPARVILGDEANEEQVAELQERMGLNDPPYVRYYDWVTAALRGDLGQSAFYPDSVASLVGQRAAVSFTLAIFAQLIALVVGLGMGVWTGLRQDTSLDRVLSTVAVSGIAVPNFVLAVGLVAIFAVMLGWFPATGYISPWADPARGWQTLVLPVFALGVRQAALIARMMRGSLIDVLSSDYMLAAKARGIGRLREVVFHGLPNAMGPTVTVIGVGFGGLISGTLIVEIVFGIPGLGRLVIDAVHTRDLVLLQGVMLAVTALYIFATLLADIVQAWLNPRIVLE